MNERERVWWQVFMIAYERVARVEPDPGQAYKRACLEASKVVDCAMKEWLLENTSEETWSEPRFARVEIMGHREHIGLVREVRVFGGAMLEVETINHLGELDGEKHVYGAKAIFHVEPLSEEDAKRRAAGLEPVLCFVCGKTVWINSGVGRPYCEEHMPKDSEEGDDCPW